MREDRPVRTFSRYYSSSSIYHPRPKFLSPQFNATYNNCRLLVVCTVCMLSLVGLEQLLTVRPESPSYRCKRDDGGQEAGVQLACLLPVLVFLT